MNFRNTLLPTAAYHSLILGVLYASRLNTRIICLRTSAPIKSPGTTHSNNAVLKTNRIRSVNKVSWERLFAAKLDFLIVYSEFNLKDNGISRCGSYIHFLINKLLHTNRLHFHLHFIERINTFPSFYLLTLFTQRYTNSCNRSAFRVNILKSK